MTKFTSEDQFPQEFKDYIAFIEEFLETKIGVHLYRSRLCSDYRT